MARYKFGYAPAKWHDRIMGRVAFDEAAAEAAVRGVYRASGLVEPGQILWANGPTDAVCLVNFVKAPPRRQRSTANVLVAFGAVIFAATALVLESGLPAGTSSDNVMFVSIMAGFVLVSMSQRAVPLASKAASCGPSLGSVAAGFAIGTMMVLYALVLQHLGSHPARSVESTGIVIAGALLGGMPGALYHGRLNAAYRHLPDPLRQVQASASVARRLRGAQTAAVWPIVFDGGHRPVDETHLRVRDHAQMQAFARQRWPSNLNPEIFGNPPIAMGLQQVTWPPGAAPSEMLQRRRAPRIPGFVDSFELARQRPVPQESNDEKMARFVELAYWLDRIYPFRTIVVAVKPASFVSTDVEGRVHADTGPAISWADGTEAFAWHGQSVAADVFETDLPITRASIEQAPDLATRRALIDRYGLGRYLSENHAREVQGDESGRLYYLDQQFDEPIVAVRVRNATAEPDGGVQEFWLRVPPATRTARQGVAWTFGLREWEYRPSVES